MSTTTACRLPDPVADRIQQAVEERGMLKSELVRRAIRHYIDENPDEIGAFASKRSSKPGDTYNPMEEL